MSVWVLTTDAVHNALHDLLKTKRLDAHRSFARARNVAIVTPLAAHLGVLLVKLPQR